jgi:hypothetical protein
MRRKLSHGLDRTKCRDTQISKHNCKESGRADIKEAFIGAPTSKRSQSNNVQYLRIHSRILKDASHEEVVNDVVAEVVMSRVVDDETMRIC